MTRKNLNAFSRNASTFIAKIDAFSNLNPEYGIQITNDRKTLIIQQPARTRISIQMIDDCSLSKETLILTVGAFLLFFYSRKLTYHINTRESFS